MVGKQLSTDLIAPAGVVNIRSGQPYDVYIGRPSKWGNPFRIGRHGSREEVLWQYERWLLMVDQKGRRRQLFHDAVDELGGKILGCYCAPLRCHGDVLREAIQHYIDGLWSS